MRAATRFALLLLSLCGAAANAQQLDLYDSDDFVDPEVTRGRVILVSRLATGASRGYMDQFRRVGQDIAFVHIANSLYWGGFQIDYKRTEVRGENPIEEDFQQFAEQFPRDASPPAPAPGPKNVTQLSWYQTFGERLTMRYRLVHATQYATPETFASVSGLDDSDETRVAQLDAGLTHGHRTHFVSFAYTELTRHSTFAGTRQRTFTVASYLPVLRVAGQTIVTRLLVGSVADEGSAIDIVNPSFDLSVHVPRLDAYVHLVYSPVYRDLGGGGNVHHQVAIFADRALLVLALGRKR